MIRRLSILLTILLFPNAVYAAPSLSTPPPAQNKKIKNNDGGVWISHLRSRNISGSRIGNSETLKDIELSGNQIAYKYIYSNDLSLNADFTQLQNPYSISLYHLGLGASFRLNRDKLSFSFGPQLGMARSTFKEKESSLSSLGFHFGLSFPLFNVRGSVGAQSDHYFHSQGPSGELTSWKFSILLPL